MPRLTVNTEISSDGVYRYEIKARKEGKGDGMRIVVPSQIIRGLKHLGWGGKWLHIRMNGEGAFIGSTRPNQKSVTLALPKWCRGEIQIGDIVQLEIRDPSDWRCTATVPIVDYGIDWAALCPSETFPVDENGTLVLHGRYRQPFKMLRVTPFAEMIWLMGFYQADGVRAKNAMDWSLSNKHAPLLARCIECLGAMGINRDRLYLEITYGTHQKAEETRPIYESLGVDIAAVRMRKSGKGGSENGVLHVRNSKPLLNMTKDLLDRMGRDNGMIESLPRHAARQLGIGSLDGDGTITITRNSVDLRLSGPERDQLATCRALVYGFDWTPMKLNFRSESDGFRRRMTAKEGVDLLLGGGFRYSLSRARLLNAMDGINCAGWDLLKPELSLLNKTDWRSGLGVKGIPYPLNQKNVVTEQK